MIALRLPAHQWLAAYAVLCLSLLSFWTAMSLSSPLWLLPMVALATPLFLKNEMTLGFGWPDSRLTPAAAGIGVGLWLPVLIFFLRTVHQEFPFAGDHDHHWLMEQAMLYELGWWLCLVPILFFAVCWISRKTKWAFFVWLIGAWALSTYFAPKEFILRYPAGFYLLAAPFNALIQSTDPLFANRLVNVLALPVYAFGLRPIFIRKWPDLRLLLFLGLFVLQKDWVYYFTTTYLEPWALIFVALSLELTTSKKDEDVQLAPLIAGIGCMFKEQAVFALALAAAHLFWRQRKAWGNFRALLTCGFFFLPFFIYYSARANAGIWRKVEAGTWNALIDWDNWNQYYVHFSANLGLTGQIAFALSLVVLAIALIKLPGQRCLIALAAALVVGSEALYIVDKQSLEYLGYARFHFLTWPLFGITVLLFDGLTLTWKKYLEWAIGFAIVLQLPPTIKLIELAGRPDIDRNYIEHYWSPISFPIRQLLATLPPSPLRREITINNPLNGVAFALTLPRVYRREFAEFAAASLSNSLVCECHGPTDVRLMLDVYRPAGDEYPTTGAMGLPSGDLQACSEKLRQTCGTVRTVIAPDGKMVGAIAFTENRP